MNTHKTARAINYTRKALHIRIVYKIVEARYWYPSFLMPCHHQPTNKIQITIA